VVGLSLYIKNNKYIIIIEDVTSVVLDKVPHNGKTWDVIQVNYKTNPAIQMPFDSEEEARQAFRQIAEYLCDDPN
jgi:hypothetical protein